MERENGKEDGKESKSEDENEMKERDPKLEELNEGGEKLGREESEKVWEELKDEGKEKVGWMKIGRM